MPAKRVTRASTRAARATAANPPTVPANPPAPTPAPVPTNVPQTAAAGGSSPRRTRSGKILGMVKSVATKLTRGRRAPKAAPMQEAAGEVEDNIDIVPTTDPATVPQPPAPPPKRGSRAAKKDENQVQIAADDAAASSSNAEPAPAPAPTKRTIKRTKSTRSQASNGKDKAPELPVEDVQAPQPTVEAIPTTPASPKSPKPVEDIERVTADLRTLNATLLADDQIEIVEHKYESRVFDNTKLKYLNTPKEAVRLVRQAYVQPQPSTHGHAKDPSQITVRVGAGDQRMERGQPHSQPPAASTSRAVVPSNPGPKPAPLKREGAVNWGYPEYYKERLRKAQQAGGSVTAADLDYPADDQAPVASSSSTVPSASTSRSMVTNGAAPSGTGNAAAASDAPPPRARLQRWNAVVLGYPEGYTPRDPWPASIIDPTGLTTHPDVVRDASGALVLPSSLSASVPLPAPRVATPPTPAAAPQPAAAATSHSPPPSSSSNESADLAEVEASISIDLDSGDVHPAADLPAPTAQPASSANPPAAAASRRATLTRQHASFFDARGREIPPHHDNDEAVVQQVIAHVLREVEAERATRPLPSASRVPITRTEPPPPVPAAARPRPAGSTGMSLFAPAGNAKGKGKANAGANTTTDADAKGKGKAVAKNDGRPPTRIFGPKPDKGKKRAREPEPEPGVQLWGYASSTGPMKVKVSLVPVVPSPKRQRVSEASGDAPATEARAAVDVQRESAPAPSEDQALPPATQHGSAKRSRAEFEEGSSRTDTDLEDEGETRPVKKLRTHSQ